MWMGAGYGNCHRDILSESISDAWLCEEDAGHAWTNLNVLWLATVDANEETDYFWKDIWTTCRQRNQRKLYNRVGGWAG